MDNTSKIEHRLDQLWSAIVAHNFDQRCAVCGKPGCDPHHWVFSRSIHKYRWCPTNGIYLCRLCHNETHADNGDNLLSVIEQHYPAMWRWFNELHQLDVQPITITGLLFLLESLETTVKALGINVK